MLKIAKSSSKCIPLKQVNVDSTIRSFAADVTITQIFRNDESTSIEAVYCFPIEEQAAIYNFTARIDDREIVAQLKEKRQAQIDYNHALQQSYSAYLLEQDEKSQDNFIINVGLLPPLKECIIRISYVTELDLIQGSIIRFVIPTTIAPRYSPQKRGIIFPSNTKSKYVQSTPYIIEFRCRIEKMFGPNHEQYISRLSSPSHQVDIDLSIHDAYLVTFTQKNMYLDRDILLDIKLSDKRANTFVVVESGAAMAAVTPFEEDCYLTLDNKQTNEFIFILDCSGSMKNKNKIGLAREAMLFFLRNLPQNCYFNIIKFGARFNCLFNQSTAFYNNVNIRIAEKFIGQIRADLGGTEILAPLQWLERHPPQTGRSRQVFLLTDGEVSNVSEVLELCRSMAASTRIFSFGLGASPSRSLVKGLARTTNGRFVFIPPNTNIDIYVGEQLQRAIRRCITNIRVEWKLGIPVENVPNQLSPAYIDDRLIIYGLTNTQTISLNPKSSIEIRTDQSYYRLGITDSDRITNNNQMIARLAAKALILELEHSKIPQMGSKQTRFDHINNDSKDDIKQRIIELSLQYNILSPYTAFIGVEKHLSGNNTDMVLREVPIQISSDNQQPRSIDIRIEKDLSHINHVDLYSLPRRAARSPVDFERPPSSKSRNNDCSIRQQVPVKYEESHHNQSTTTVRNRPSSLSNDQELRFRCTEETVVHKSQNEIDSTDDKNTVHYLLNKQRNDGLWNFPSNRTTIKDLTGKSLAVFQSSDTHNNTEILVTAIVIVLFESKFIALRSMWDNAVEKARERLIKLLNNDWKKLIILLRNIRIILNS